MRACVSDRGRLPAYKDVSDEQIPKLVHISLVFEFVPRKKAQDSQSYQRDYVIDSNTDIIVKETK